MNPSIYKQEELAGLTDDELLEILARSWGIDDGKFEIWGELPPLGDSTFGFIRNPHLLKSNEQLFYPLEGQEIEPCQFFMAPQDALKCGSKSHSRFVCCELELSPLSEREKHKNPLGLCVKKGTAERLRHLPQTLSQDAIVDRNSDGTQSQLIAQSIYDFYYEKAIEDMEDEIDKRRYELQASLTEYEKQLEEVQKKKDTSVSVVEKLNERYKKLIGLIEELNSDETAKRIAIEKLSNHYEQIEAEMNTKIERLRSYVSDKAQFLKTFDFIDEDDLSSFLLETGTQDKLIDGVSFRDDLNGDYQQAVSYIQSHLVKDDILYPRHIIENFITLLRTKDLTILAGDSGSGKTNLVKSFAKAVGGKSVIVPVKPNWTSSEDLLGYYNPLEKRYLSTPFLEALIEAQQHPETPYFICLDEMNLARVEYYFADFLSLLETRNEVPEIKLYAQDESSHVLSELRAVVDIINSTREKYKSDGVINFIDLLKDDELNNQLRMAFGFSDKDSLLKYHSEVRRMLSAIMTMPASIKMPENVHIIGAINIDETTHYLSPKILDRAHIMRFESPLLSDWDVILKEVDSYDFEDTSKPLIFDVESLGIRNDYPKFDRNNPFCELFIELNKDFFHKLGVEFGMRTIRQGLNYLAHFQHVNSDKDIAVNNFLLHKVLPKLTFDGNKTIGQHTKLELMERVLLDRVKQALPNHEEYDDTFSAVNALEGVIENAKANDGVVNFWS